VCCPPPTFDFLLSSQAYHSSFNNHTGKNLCNMAVLPLKTKYKGPAPPLQQGADVIDEALDFFKANVLFRNFEIKGTADRTLIYLTLYISKCLQKLGRLDKGGAEKAVYQLAIENFALPGDRNFALGGIVSNPQNRGETDAARQYFTQLRQETGIRLVERVYARNASAPDKWWMCFQKKKFLQKVRPLSSLPE
jgi:actin related protein 2/3 complex, subunit 3